MNDIELLATSLTQIEVSNRLLPSLLALQKIGSGTATQVSAVTNRCRAFESKNLNQLTEMGVVAKQRIGHEQIFTAKTQNK